MKLSPNDPLAARARPAVVRPAGNGLVVGEAAGGPQFRPEDFLAQAEQRAGAAIERGARKLERQLATKHRAKSPEQARPEANGLQAGITLPLRTARGLNNREHHFARARRVKREREAVAVALLLAHLEVTLTRISPRGGGDDDGDVGALKSVRDQVAAWLGIDDGLKHRLRFVYGEPERGPWAVRVEVRLVSR